MRRLSAHVNVVALLYYMRKLWHICVTIVIMTSISVLAAEPITILPLGDSITEGGKAFVCYRQVLIPDFFAAAVPIAGDRTCPVSGTREVVEALKKLDSKSSIRKTRRRATDLSAMHARSFKSLLADGKVIAGKNTTTGVKGSKIDVNNKLVEMGSNAKNLIPKDIAIHTLCNSVIPRKNFGKWTRWYQEDGNTQVFRLFKGEHNVRNERPGAARVESFSRLKWQRGDWRQWEGTYTILKPHGCAIFQAKNNKNDWGVMINLSDNGDITLNHRRHQKDEVIAKNMTGKSFDLKVRDNGHDYEVFLNGKKVGTGYYARPEGHTSFRWGMYGKTIKHDALIFVTGAKFN